MTELGFGMLKVLVTAGYGTITAPDNIDHSVNAVGSPNGCPNATMTYELSPEGHQLMKAALLQQIGCAS